MAKKPALARKNPQPTVTSTKSSEIDDSTTPLNGISLRSGSMVISGEKTKKYNTMKLVEVPKIADRYNVSNAAVAAISTATLVDAGLITKDDMLLVCDKNKVRRARQNQREVQMKNLSFEGIRAIYFDGKIDTQTLVFENGRKKVGKEDHISFVQQPGSFFIGHKTIPTGSSLAHLNAMKEIIEEKSIPPDDMMHSEVMAR